VVVPAINAEENELLGSKKFVNFANIV